jgi:signal transduction histidine kinase
MNAKKYAVKKNLRLLIILVYLLISIPIQFSFMHNFRQNTKLELAIKFIIFALFIIFELIEYCFDYPNGKKILVRVLFSIRLFSILGSFVLWFYNNGHVEPFLFNFIPLLAFYSFFVIPRNFSILFTIAISTISVWLDITDLTQKNLEIYYTILLMFQRIIIIIIFYLFGHFWQTDIQKTKENEELLEKLNKSEENLRKYAREIAKTSVLEERTRIARDMHDSIGHSLTAIQIQLRTALAFIPVNITKTEQSINAALEVAESSLQDIRDVLSDIREDEKQFSFKEKITPFISTLSQGGIVVKLDIAKDDENFNYASLVALYRLVQEGTTNILKHSKAKQVSILLSYSEDEAEFIIEDDGIGFNTQEQLADVKSGMGLHGLIERFELIRGNLKIESSSNAGTKIIAHAPKDPVKLIGEEIERN